MSNPNVTRCPICGRTFNVKYSWKHIDSYHPKASDKELILIRDAKRKIIPFVRRPVTHPRNTIISSPYRPECVMFSGGLPSLGRKK